MELEHGRYSVDLRGASGGLTTKYQINQPGKGGKTHGIIKIKGKSVFHLFVGSKGGDSNVNTPGSAGFNGGVIGAKVTGSDNYSASGSSGCSTDLRIKGGLCNDAEGLSSRIIVAAGGGSAGCWYYSGIGGN